METLKKNREEALAAHELAWTCMIDWQRSSFIPFKLGDRVWLDTRNLKTNHHKKIGPKREGPFEIIKVIGPVTYQLRLPKTWKIHNVFHTMLLRQYKETEVYGANFNKPPPERRRSVWGGEYPATSEKRKGVSILRPMERLPNLGRLVGTSRGVLWRWGFTKAVQRTPPALIKMNTQQKNQQNATWTKIPVNRK